MEINEILAHPFFLLIMGAIISSILVPKFSQRWQDRKKRLEIRIDLVTQISKVVASWELDTRAILMSKEPPTERNPEWRVNGASITAILFAYFPTEAIYIDWKKYYHTLDQFWWFSRMIFHGNVKDEHKKDLSIFKEFLKEDSEKIDWDIFFDIKNSDDAAKSGGEWSKLIDMLAEKQNDILASVLESKIKSI